MDYTFASLGAAIWALYALLRDDIAESRRSVHEAVDWLDKITKVFTKSPQEILKKVYDFAPSRPGDAMLNEFTQRGRRRLATATSAVADALPVIRLI